MTRLFGDLLPYAVPVALSPLPIIAVAMLLLAPAGTRGGLAFLAGRLAALAVAALAFALLAGLVDAGDGEKRGWLRIGLGALLIAGAWLAWRKDRGAAAEMPGWMRSIDRATPAAALRLGAVLTLANPKELAFAAGAGAMIAGAGAGAALAAALAFALVAGLGVVAPVAVMRMGGAAARARLATARDWLVANQAIVMAAMLLVTGAMLVGSGIEAL